MSATEYCVFIVHRDECPTRRGLGPLLCLQGESSEVKGTHQGKAGGSWEPRWTRLWVLMSKTSLLNRPSEQHAQTFHERAQDRHLFLRTTDSFLLLSRKTKLKVKKTQFLQISTMATKAPLWPSLPERTRQLLPVLHSHPQSHYVPSSRRLFSDGWEDPRPLLLHTEARVSSRSSRLTNISILSQAAPQILAVFLANFQLQGNVTQNVWWSSTPLAVGEMTGPSHHQMGDSRFPGSSWERPRNGRRGFSQPWKHSPPGLGFPSAERVFWGEGVHGAATVIPAGQKN